MHPILFPTDFTADCDVAFQIACSIARDRACEIIVLHVIHSEGGAPRDADGSELDADSIEYQSYWRRFARYKGVADDLPLRFRLETGCLVDTVIAVSSEENCDLILVAAHPHNYLHRQIYGSVSESLAKRCRCSVVCLNPPGYRQERLSILAGLRQELIAETEAARS